MRRPMDVTEPGRQLALVTPPPSDVTFVNGRCVITEQAGICVVTVSGIPVYVYERGDETGRAIFIAQGCGEFATGDELAAALDGVSRSTVFRYQRRYVEEGAAGLIKTPVQSKEQPSLGDAQDRAIRKWHEEGVSGRQIAQRLKEAIDRGLWAPRSNSAQTLIARLSDRAGPGPF